MEDKPDFVKIHEAIEEVKLSGKSTLILGGIAIEMSLASDTDKST